MATERFPYRESDYARRIIQEPTTDGGTVYSAWYAELPGCESQGDTEEEARENLKDAFELYMSDLQRRGLPIPPPGAPMTQVRDVVSRIVTSGQSPISSSISYGTGFTSDGTDLLTLVASVRR
jgi:predicted RNase H-like HicB family nuclease